MCMIALCDDDMTELDKVENMIRAYGERNADCHLSVERFTAAEELLGAVREKKCVPDLVFLDIYMPEKTGMEAARELREMKAECRIIFLTSSKEHALEAYRVDAVQYLVKPIVESDLFLLLDKTLESPEKAQKRYLLLRAENKDYRIAVQDVVFCEAQKKRQSIWLADGTHFSLGMTMNKIYEMLSDYREFTKVGVSYIVNIEHIVSLSTQEIQMDNEERIYLPRGSYLSLREKYFDYYCREE